jgi:hypothetical protein
MIVQRGMIFVKVDTNKWAYWIRRVWGYQRSNQNPYIAEEQTRQWPKEKWAKWQTTIHKTYKWSSNTNITNNCYRLFVCALPLEIGIPLTCLNPPHVVPGSSHISWSILCSTTWEVDVPFVNIDYMITRRMSYKKQVPLALYEYLYLSNVFCFSGFSIIDCPFGFLLR